MAFKENIRNFWLGAGDNKCQFEYYDDRKGWQKCTKKAQQVHHIKGEGETLASGGNPHNNVGLPLCENHHVRNESNQEHSKDFGFHTDVAHAYKTYSTWKTQEQHMNSITGKKTINYNSSPFADVGREHNQMIKRGERYINGDENIDQYYEDKMKQKGVIYSAEHGSRPHSKSHPKQVESKREKKWYNFWDSD